jgi:hypothetical protein
MKRTELHVNGVKRCEVMVADNFWTRFKGLMGKKSETIEQMGGLLIKPCSQIHTFFMKCAIDVIYLDRDNRIIKIEEAIPPGKCCKLVKGSKSLVEFPINSINKYGFKENDKVEVL